MRIRHVVGAAAAATALALPSAALATGKPLHPTHPSHPARVTQPGTSTPGPKAGLAAKAKAYGRYCQGQSKTHVAGTPGTPFSTCVTDMAKLATGRASNPHTVCLNESKRHVAHTQGTPYSLCVAGAKKLLKAAAPARSRTTATSPGFTATALRRSAAPTASTGFRRCRPA